METPPLRYAHLTQPELEAQLAQLNEQKWNVMDLLHAIEIGRTAVFLALGELRHGTQE